MIFGNTSTGASTQDLASDVKRVARYTLGSTVLLSKLSAAVDGLGAGIGNQVLKGVVYNASGVLVATSNEVLVMDGAALAWVDFTFSRPVTLVAGNYDLGLIAGTTSNTTRIYYAASGTGSFNADTYSNGPASPFGTPTAHTQKLSIFATAAFAFSAPTGVTDEFLGTLPFPDAQAAIASTQPLPGSGQRASIGWHGTKTDPERGSYAIVQKDGILSDLVGERVKITADERSVVVYVRDERDVLEDISLTRRLFTALSRPNAEELEGTIEILGSET